MDSADGEARQEGAQTGHEDDAAWAARVADDLGPLDDRDREVLALLLTRREG